MVDRDARGHLRPRQRASSSCPGAVPRRPGTTRSCARGWSAKYPDIRIGIVSATPTRRARTSAGRSSTPSRPTPPTRTVFPDCDAVGREVDRQGVAARRQPLARQQGRDAVRRRRGRRDHQQAVRPDPDGRHPRRGEHPDRRPARRRSRTGSRRRSSRASPPTGWSSPSAPAGARATCTSSSCTPTAQGGIGWEHHVVSALTATTRRATCQSYWPEYWPVERLLQGARGDGLAPCSRAPTRTTSSGSWRATSSTGPFDHFDDPPRGPPVHPPDGRRPRLQRRASGPTSPPGRRPPRTPAGDCPNKGTSTSSRPTATSVRATTPSSSTTAGWPTRTSAWSSWRSQQFQSTLIQEVMEEYPRIPIEGKTADVDKTTRARAVAAKYEAHKVHHHSRLRGSAFETELLSFPKGHDDFVDALGLLDGPRRPTSFFFGSLKTEVHRSFPSRVEVEFRDGIAPRARLPRRPHDRARDPHDDLRGGHRRPPTGSHGGRPPQRRRRTDSSRRTSEEHRLMGVDQRNLPRHARTRPAPRTCPPGSGGLVFQERGKVGKSTAALFRNWAEHSEWVRAAINIRKAQVSAPPSGTSSPSTRRSDVDEGLQAGAPRPVHHAQRGRRVVPLVGRADHRGHPGARRWRDREGAHPGRQIAALHAVDGGPDQGQRAVGRRTLTRPATGGCPCPSTRSRSATRTWSTSWRTRGPTRCSACRRSRPSR